MEPLSAAFFTQEQGRLVALAQDLFLGRGIGPVSLTDVALALRQPVAVVEGYFPGGKSELVSAITEHYLAGFRLPCAPRLARKSCRSS